VGSKQPPLPAGVRAPFAPIVAQECAVMKFPPPALSYLTGYGDKMNEKEARKIILHAVETTKPRWEQYKERWDDIDSVFIRRGYEQQGFEAWKFAEMPGDESIFSIKESGSILDRYNGDRKYNRAFAGSLATPLYQNMQGGAYGEEGKKFYKCVSDFEGKRGRCFWRILWQMLVCCNYLMNEYQSSFSYFLKKKYAEFKNRRSISDEDFLKISSENWEEFRKGKPWKELHGIGENVFDFIIGDIVEADLVKDSYKLDSANEHFFEVTGISKLLGKLEREDLMAFLKKLRLPSIH
jgi:hypothetical protein